MYMHFFLLEDTRNLCKEINTTSFHLINHEFLYELFLSSPTHPWENLLQTMAFNVVFHF